MRLLASILSLAAATAAGVPFVLSNTLGSHMVLQRDRPATIWGFGTPNTVVKTVFRGQTLVSSVGADGVFRQALPATGAGGPYTIGVSASTGESAVLSDVLFGDVYFCSGQSNMQFTLSQAVNASAEIAAANGYPSIRVMSVGDGSTSYTPLSQLASLQLGWTVANSSVIGYGNWSYFSAVCWLFARDVFNGLGGKVPIGAISSNWGGTRIQAWSSPQANAACNSSYAEEHEDWLAAQEALLESSRLALGGSAEDAITAEELGVLAAAAAPGRLGAGGGPGPNNASVLWNAMVVPFTVGPMAMTGITWFQGEANAGQASVYKYCQPAMVADWRTHFNDAQLWFGFVLMEPWITTAPLAQLRDAQEYTLQALPNTAYGAAIDIGDPLSPFGSVHPRHKQVPAGRLANAALNQIYAQNTPLLGPVAQAATGSAAGTMLTVTVQFPAGSSLALQAAHCPTELGVPASICAWYGIQGSDWNLYNATAAVTADGNGLELTATAKTAGVKPLYATYGYGPWPIITVYGANGLPAIPFNQSVTAQ